MQQSEAPRRSFNVLAEPFYVDPSYEFVKELGQGAYGWVWIALGIRVRVTQVPCISLVCAAKNAQTGDSVAIKKVSLRKTQGEPWPNL